MFRRPVFWLAAAAVCVAAGIFAIIYFPSAFPIVSLDIRMDRGAALASARELTERFGWGPEGYRQAASFGLTAGDQVMTIQDGDWIQMINIIKILIFHLKKMENLLLMEF